MINDATYELVFNFSNRHLLSRRPSGTNLVESCSYTQNITNREKV